MGFDMRTKVGRVGRTQANQVLRGCVKTFYFILRESKNSKNTHEETRPLVHEPAETMIRRNDHHC